MDNNMLGNMLRASLANITEKSLHITSFLSIDT